MLGLALNAVNYRDEVSAKLENNRIVCSASFILEVNRPDTPTKMLALFREDNKFPQNDAAWREAHFGTC